MPFRYSLPAKTSTNKFKAPANSIYVKSDNDFLIKVADRNNIVMNNLGKALNRGVSDDLIPPLHIELPTFNDNDVAHDAAFILAAEIRKLSPENLEKLDITLVRVDNNAQHIEFMATFKTEMLKFKLSKVLFDLNNNISLHNASRAIYLLFESPLFKSVISKNLRGILDVAEDHNLSIQDKLKIENLLTNLFITQQGLNYDEKTLNNKVRDVELSLLAYADKDLDLKYKGLKYRALKKSSVDEILLTITDVQISLYHLAKNNPDSAPKLLKVHTTYIRDLKDSLKLVKSINDYPAHVIINTPGTPGHWTRLKIEEHGGYITATYIDSKDDLEGTKKSLREEQVQQALLDAGFSEEQITLQSEFNGNQSVNDIWSCGYHALAGVARDLGIDNAPQAKNGAYIELESNNLRDWLFNLVIGQSYAAYNADNKRVNLPANSPQRRTERSNTNATSIGSSKTPRPTPFSKGDRQFIETLYKDLNYQGLNPKKPFNETHQKYILTPTDPDKNYTLEITKTNVTAKNASSLDEVAKEKLAGDMVKIYIANELGLSGAGKFPENDDVIKKLAGIEKVTYKALTGTDEKLKELIIKKLDSYGIKPEIKPSATNPAKADASPEPAGADEAKEAPGNSLTI